MRASELFMPTLKEDPADSEAVSHRLLVRGGFVRRFSAGMYIFLPLGWRVMERVNSIMREEMNAIGGQEVSMPTLHPAEVWKETGRYDEIGPEMFRLNDRSDRPMVLAMTHEEIFAWMAGRELRSYRDLPQTWYQIQLKFRDEPRAKGGILRVREFLMKDSYSFDIDEDGLEESYARHAGAYDRILSRCGLDFYRVDSDPGMMGGAQAHEYMAPSAAGEDRVAICPACGYAANTELARSKANAAQGEEESGPREVATPGQKSIEQVSDFLGIPASSLIKTLAYQHEDGFVLALVRGDHELRESKLARYLQHPVRAASPDEVAEVMGTDVGSIGPVGASARVVTDEALSPRGPAGKRGYVVGANKNDIHLRGVVPGEDWETEFTDLHEVQEGEGCPDCGAPVHLEQVIEVGNIFKLGTRYSEPLGATVLGEDGKERPLVMGSYGIGPARVAAAAVEQNHDDDGICWPRAIAPFDVYMVTVKMEDEKQRELSQELYTRMTEEGWECLWDDRQERAGVKFKDAELIGCPVRITVGRGATDGLVELEARVGKEREDVPVDRLMARMQEVWQAAP